MCGKSGQRLQIRFFKTLNKVLCTPSTAINARNGPELHTLRPIQGQHDSNAFEFFVMGPPPIPPAAFINGSYSSETIVAVDLSNVVHHGVQEQHRMCSCPPFGGKMYKQHSIGS